MKFKSRIEILSEDDILVDSTENSVIKFTPSSLINDVYRSNHSIKFVYNGHEDYDIEGDFERLGKGETLLVNGERSVSAQSCGEAVAIFLEDDLVNEVSNELYHGDDMQSKANFHRTSSHNFSSIWARIATDPDAELTEEFYYEMATRYVTSFVTYSDLESRVQLKKATTKNTIFGRLEIAKSYILDHSYRRITLDEVAREAAMSKFYLIHSFKRLYNTTPLRLHSWLRINRAKELIKNDQHSLTEIANKLDYTDLPAFSKQFKQFAGVSPSQFNTSYIN